MGWLASIRNYFNNKIRKLLPRERDRGVVESEERPRIEIYLHPADVIQSLQRDFDTDSDESDSLHDCSSIN